MLQQAILNYLETKEKILKILQIDTIKKKQIEITELKNNNLKKISLDKLNSRMELREKRISEPEDIIIESIQSKQHIGKELKKQ